MKFWPQRGLWKEYPQLLGRLVLVSGRRAWRPLQSVTCNKPIRSRCMPRLFTSPALYFLNFLKNESKKKYRAGGKPVG